MVVSAHVVAPTAAQAASVGRLEVDVTRPGHAELAWTQVSGASSYTVARNGNSLMTGNTLRFDDTSIAYGASYTYAVTAQVNGNPVDVGSRTVQVPARWDSGPPTAVSGLKVTSKTDTSISLSWTASTDDVGVVAYLVTSGGVRVGFTEGPTTLTVKNLQSATAYTLTVRALDAWGNQSSPVSVSATTSTSTDTTAPSTPSGVKVIPYSSSRIDVTWGAASDGHSLAGYLIYRSDQANPIATVLTAQARVFSDTNVAPGVTYGYQVQAFDSAGNKSGKSTLRSTAPLAAGVVKVVRGPLVQQVDQTSSQVTWQTNIPATSELDYTIGGVTTHVTDAATRTQHAVLIGDLTPNATVTYSITYPSSTKSGTFRTCGQVGDSSNIAVVGDFGGGGTAENDIATRIANYAPDQIISTGDNVYPAAENVDFDAKFFTPYAAAFAKAPFTTAFGNHEYYDPGAASTHANLTQPSNESWYSYDCGSVHTLVLDTEIPYKAGSPQYQFAQTDLASATAPWRVVVLHRPPYSSSQSASGVRAALTPLFEQFGVQLVFQGHSHNYERTNPINGVTYVVTGGGGNGLNSFTTTQPSWSAFRAAEYNYVRMNVTPSTITLSARRRDDTVLDSATLSRTGDVTAPSAPANLHETSSGASSVSMAWDASTDDTGVTNYRVFRNGFFLTQLGNVTSFTDSGLQAGVNYTYTVRAVDAAENTSDASDPLTVSTGNDTSPPSIPQNLRVTYDAPGHVEFAWDASTDDTGVTSYQVFRDGSLYDTVGGTTTNYNDTQPQAGDSHTYRVQAVDAATNLSGLSDPLTITVPSSSSSLFSDDFESGSMSKWTSVNGLTVEQGYTAPSGGAWVARENASGAGSTYAYTSISPTLSEIYAEFRFMVNSRNGSVDLMRFRNGSGGSKLSLFIDGSTGKLSTRNASGTTLKSSAVINTGQWYTVEIHGKIGTTPVTDVWLNGTLVTELGATGNLGTTSFGQFLLGNSGTTGTYDVVFDDVVVSKNQI